MMQITWDDLCKAVDDMQWMVGDLRQSADSIHCDADYLYTRELKTDHWHSGVESSYQSIKEEMHRIKITLSLLETVMTRLESIKPHVLERQPHDHD